MKYITMLNKNHSKFSEDRENVKAAEKSCRFEIILWEMNNYNVRILRTNTENHNV